MNDEFKIKFRGVRGSIPVPGKNTLRYGGNTTCIEVRVDGHLIIFDSGTGIISLGQEMMSTFMAMDENVRANNPMNAVMLFTHTHLDHLIGLPFFTPIFIGSTKLYMFGAKYDDNDFKNALSMSMHSPLFPVEFDNLHSMRDVKNIKEGDVILLKKGIKEPEIQNIFRPTVPFPDDAVKIYVHQSYAHPCDGTLVYKIEYKSKTMVFATDIEGYKSPDSRLVKFSKDVDILIHDAQYTNEQYNSSQGFGHSTMEMATDVAKAANVKKLYLFHHDPRHTDDNLDAILLETKKLFSETYMAMEGEEIDLFI
ncbi:MAG: MBL fold metallo-hydrolase [Candidatus Sericytochromatia bacterium]|nr:MBL fold metallo-hydrolase [Candidatus Sericytochromatia bacterium]